jgi:nitrite reductase/ring-hydroxylating ferredoxin subunit
MPQDKVNKSISNNKNPLTAHTRRRFVRDFVVGSALSTLLGKTWLATVLADCQPSHPGDGILQVTVADYPALQNPNGSVRLTFKPFNPIVPLGGAGSFYLYPVLINRGANNQFFTLSSQCQHQLCIVPPYDPNTGASTCPCHLSQYALDGSVLRGPTPGPLIPYPNSFDGATLCIEIPKLGFSLNATAVQGGAGPRLQLSFPTQSGFKYQVLFRQSAADPGTVIAFATTSDGSATSQLLTGNGSAATVFVDRTTDSGFYSVAVQVNQA